MFKPFSTLLRDEVGFILSAELILIATVVTLGLVVGLAEVSNAVNGEMGDMAGAVQGLSQDYWYNGSGNWGGNSGGYDFDHTQNW